MNVHLDPLDLDFEASSADTVLDAGEAQGIFIPSSCRNGTCRTCLSQLRAGEVRYIVEWPGVSAEEQAKGWFLPCVAQACTDLVVHNEAAHSL